MSVYQQIARSKSMSGQMHIPGIVHVVLSDSRSGKLSASTNWGKRQMASGQEEHVQTLSVNHFTARTNLSPLSAPVFAA